MKIYVDIYNKLDEFDLNINFKSNGTIGLLGSSGSGKSMTLKCISGIEKPDGGIIKINGDTVFDSEKGINLPAQKRNIGFVFQNYALFPHMTVLDNISFGINKKNNMEKIQSIVHKVEISNLLDRYPGELSGGQQQRVAIARVLARDPKVLLFDEPLSALDNYLKSQLEEWLDDLIKEFTGPTVFVSHNINEVIRICDNIVVLSKGNVIEQGLMQEVLNNPTTLETATITGCQNIFTASFHNDFSVYVKDLDIYLKTNKTVPKDISHIGIYGRDIFFSDDHNANTISCKIKNTYRDLNLISLHLLPSRNKGLIHLTLTHREFENINVSQSVNIYIPEDRIIFLK